MKPRDVWSLGKNAAEKWNEHNAPRLGAALAYYTLLSLAPVVVLLVLLCGLVFERRSAEQHVLEEVRNMAGREWVATFKNLIDNARPTAGGIIASIAALGCLFFGASGVFVELRDSLNTIWDAPTCKSGVSEVIRRRIASFITVFFFGVLMLLSVLIDVALQIVETHFVHFLPVNAAYLGEVANVIASFVMIAVLFGLIFKFVPDVRIAWKDVAIGAVVTAGLFTIGRTLLALYLTKAAVGSAFGAAGSLVASVAWIYYCAQIFFFGAILTRVYALSFGSHRWRRK